MSKTVLFFLLAPKNVRVLVCCSKIHIFHDTPIVWMLVVFAPKQTFLSIRFCTNFWKDPCNTKTETQ